MSITLFSLSLFFLLPLFCFPSSEGMLNWSGCTGEHEENILDRHQKCDANCHTIANQNLHSPVKTCLNEGVSTKKKANEEKDSILHLSFWILSLL